MHLRRQGVPKNQFCMRLVMLVMRVCLAAYLTDKEATTMLGRGGHLLRHVIRFTHTRSFILRASIKDADRLLGIGGQYLVFASSQHPDMVEKYSYTLAGADERILAQALTDYIREHEYMVAHYGDLVQPTNYDVAELPLRGVLGKLTTIRARQPRLRDMLDVFAPEAEQLLRGPHPKLRKDVATIAKQTRAWIAQNKWLDLIGPDNVVITREDAQLRLRIIDTEAYVAGYLADTNPMIGKSYREVLMDRLRTIELYTKHLVLGALWAGGLWFVYKHVMPQPMRHTTFAVIDRIEDGMEDAVERVWQVIG